MKTYGEYGIGLRKEWGVKKYISPVFYVHKRSKILRIIAKIPSQVKKEFTQNNVEEKFRKNILNPAVNEIFGLIKPYKGKLWRNGEYTKTLRFYDEREWRFVPMKYNFKYGINKNRFFAERESLNEKIWKKVVLPFKPSDIKYIIVSDDDEIIPIIKEIERIARFNQEDKKLLSSRVISAERIAEDF